MTLQRGDELTAARVGRVRYLETDPRGDYTVWTGHAIRTIHPNEIRRIHRDRKIPAVPAMRAPTRTGRR